MTARFAAIEAKINQAVYRHLANATGDFGNGLLVDGIFSFPSAEVMALVGGNSPTFVVAAASVASVVRNHTVTINNVVYKIVDKQLDGIGNVTLVLVKV